MCHSASLRRPRVVLLLCAVTHSDDGCAAVATCRGIEFADVVNVLDITLDDGPHAPIWAATPA